MALLGGRADLEKGSLPARGGLAGAGATGTDYFLGFCRFINVITGFSILLCLVAHALALVQGPPFTERETLCQQLLRVYGVAISVSLIVVETEWQWAMAWMRAMDLWAVRGLAQGFLAALTYEVATANGETDFDKSVVLYRHAAVLCMLGCAGFYLMGGVLCIGALKNARYKRMIDRLRMESDLQTLEKQQRELQGLLATYAR